MGTDKVKDSIWLRISVHIGSSKCVSETWMLGLCNFSESFWNLCDFKKLLGKSYRIKEKHYRSSVNI